MGRVLMALLAASLAAGAARGATFTVTTPADGGPGSLRAAIESANDSPGSDKIRFALAGEEASTITLESRLPAIMDRLEINGAGKVTVSGGGLAGGAQRSQWRIGLQILASGSSVKNLTFVDFLDGPSPNGVAILVGDFPESEGTVSKVTVKDNRVFVTDPETFGGPGIALINAEDVEIRNNDVRHTAAGILGRRARNGVIRDNVISEARVRGIGLVAQANSNEIRGNRISESTESIFVTGSWNRVTDNVLCDNGDESPMVFGDGNRVEYNDCTVD